MKDTRTILFLGGGGFLGLNVLDCYFNSENTFYKFIVVGRKESPPPKNRQISYVTADFSETGKLEDIFINNKIDEVFHFISTSVPATANNNIVNDINSNLINTVKLLDLLVKYGVKKIIYLSSGGTVYGDPHMKIFQEQESYKLKNSYSIVKFSVEKYIELYKDLYNIDYLIIRLSNPFGINHHSNVNGIINLAIRKSLNGEKLTIWGDGNHKKDYIFSKDFANIFWQLHALDVKNIILNVGSGITLSVNEVLKFIKDIVPELTWVYTPEKGFDTKMVDFRLDQLKSIVAASNTDISESIMETYNWEKLKIIT